MNKLRLRIKEILKELDFGKNLFADPTSPAIDDKGDYKKFIKGDQEAPNTEEEEEVLRDIHRFTITQYDDIKALQKNAQKLLQLKSKFPGMLDPKQGKDVGEYIWRGATLPKEIITKIAPKVNENGYAEINLNITPRSKRGIHSFSSNFYKATQFMDMQWNSKYRNGRIPVVIGVKSDNPNFLLNPDFLENITNYPNEREILYVGDTFPVSKVYIEFSTPESSRFEGDAEFLKSLKK